MIASVRIFRSSRGTRSRKTPSASFFKPLARDAVLARVPGELLAVGCATNELIEGLREFYPSFFRQSRERTVLIMGQIELPTRRDVDVVGHLLGEALQRKSVVAGTQELVCFGNANQIQNGSALETVCHDDHGFLCLRE